MTNNNFENFKEILKNKQYIKPPAYPWQDLALRVIEELRVPAKKRNSVFQAAKKYPKATIEKALTDTKELCKTGECWKYFFKVIGNLDQTKKSAPDKADGDKN